MTRRLTAPEEQLIRELVEGKTGTGGFACRVEDIRALLEEIDVLRGVLGSRPIVSMHNSAEGLISHYEAWADRARKLWPASPEEALPLVPAPPPAVKPNMDQILAECGCIRTADCTAVGRCLAEGGPW